MGIPTGGRFLESATVLYLFRPAGSIGPFAETRANYCQGHPVLIGLKSPRIVYSHSLNANESVGAAFAVRPARVLSSFVSFSRKPAEND